MRPVVILASSVADGEAYAEVLGIETYRIATPNARGLEGLIIRAVVVTPAFAALLMREALEAAMGDVRRPATRAFNTARRNAAMTGAPRG